MAIFCFWELRANGLRSRVSWRCFGTRLKENFASILTKAQLAVIYVKMQFYWKKNQEQGKRSPFPFSWPLAHYHFNRKNELRPLTSTWCAWHDLSIACEVQLTWWWGHFKAVICYLNNIKTQISRVENVYTLHAYFSRLTNDTGCGKWRGGKRWHLGRVNRGVSPTALETG